MGFSLIPKDEKFFDLLEEASDNVIHSASVFRDMVATWQQSNEKAKEIRELEHAGDRMTHEIFNRLNRTFITPIDREDIHALASELDDVVDIIQSTTDRMLLYRIDSTSASLVNMANVLLQSAEVIGKAVKSLRDLTHSRRTLDFCIEANRLENEGDVFLKTAIGELFANQNNVLEIIKWKEIYEATEFAIDKCEDIANTIEGIIVKNA
jgi:predicted phosphate transport protein (TIGR00153 family)